MNVSTEIIDLMFNIPSDDIHLLNNNQLSLVFRRSPVYDEWIKSKCSDLSTKEYNDLRIINNNPNNLFPKYYIDQIQNKYQTFQDCQDAIVLIEYRKILKEYTD